MQKHGTDFDEKYLLWDIQSRRDLSKTEIHPGLLPGLFKFYPFGIVLATETH